MQFLVYFGKWDPFLKDIVVSVQLDCFSPVVEAAGNKDLVCSIRPGKSRSQRSVPQNSIRLSRWNDRAKGR